MKNIGVMLKHVLISIFVLFLFAGSLQAQSKKEKKAIAEITKADAYALSDCKCKAGVARIEVKQKGDNIASARESEEFNAFAEKFDAYLTAKYKEKKDRKPLFDKYQDEARLRLASCKKFRQLKGDTKPRQEKNVGSKPNTGSKDRQKP
ncbi:MAG: hypothetical protein Q8S18_12175 [Bacteroidales bacterium]|nr:hypothetical protein [Bacteroidales bacterium]